MSIITFKEEFKIHLALLSVAFLYGANYNIAKQITPEPIAPFALVIIRVVLSTVLFWIAGIFIKSAPIPKKILGSLVIASIFGTAGTQMMFLKGLSLTSPINASVIMTLTPVMVFIISAIFLGEHLNRFKIAGILLGISGAFFLVGGQNFQFSGVNTIGDIIIFFNTTVFAIYLVLIKKFMIKYPPITIVKWVFLLGCPMVIPFGLEDFLNINWSTLSTSTWVSTAYVAIGATFLVYLLNTIALSKVNASLVGFYIYLQPVIATCIAILFLGETLSLEKIFFSIMIFSGVGLISIKTKKTSPSEKEEV